MLIWILLSIIVSTTLDIEENKERIEDLWIRLISFNQIYTFCEFLVVYVSSEIAGSLKNYFDHFLLLKSIRDISIAQNGIKCAGPKYMNTTAFCHLLL